MEQKFLSGPQCPIRKRQFGSRVMEINRMFENVKDQAAGSRLKGFSFDTKMGRIIFCNPFCNPLHVRLKLVI